MTFFAVYYLLNHIMVISMQRGLLNIFRLKSVDWMHRVWALKIISRGRKEIVHCFRFRIFFIKLVSALL